MSSGPLRRWKYDAASGIMSEEGTERALLITNTEIQCLNDPTLRWIIHSKSTKQKRNSKRVVVVGQAKELLIKPLHSNNIAYVHTATGDFPLPLVAYVVFAKIVY